MKHEEVKDRVKYFFLRDKKKFPCACVASFVDEKNGVVNVGFSTYNTSDEFNKHIAKGFALKRLLSGEIMFVSQDPHLIKSKIMQRILDVRDFERGKLAPTAIREAAKLWLKNAKKKQEVEKNKAA